VSSPSRDEALEAWCRSMWQTHEARQRHPGYKTKWPARATFKAEWPLLAPDLIEAQWMIEGAESDSTVTTIAYQLLDPAPPAKLPWQQRYWEELMRWPRIALALVGESPVGQVFLMARLSPGEDQVARLRLASGDSLDGDETTFGAIAHHVGKRKGNVWVMWRRALYKLRDLVQPREESAA
jgi:hypothetical protein